MKLYESMTDPQSIPNGTSKSPESQARRHASTGFYGWRIQLNWETLRGLTRLNRFPESMPALRVPQRRASCQRVKRKRSLHFPAGSKKLSVLTHKAGSLRKRRFPSRVRITCTKRSEFPIDWWTITDRK